MREGARDCGLEVPSRPGKSACLSFRPQSWSMCVCSQSPNSRSFLPGYKLWKLSASHQRRPFYDNRPRELFLARIENDQLDGDLLEAVRARRTGQAGIFLG